MQTRITFQCLKRAIESTLVCPSIRDALEQLAQLVPSGTGPHADLLDSALIIDDHVWRFRTVNDARRFADLMETYFRNFDSQYRIRTIEHAPEAGAAVGFL